MLGNRTFSANPIPIPIPANGEIHTTVAFIASYHYKMFIFTQAIETLSKCHSMF